MAKRHFTKQSNFYRAPIHHVTLRYSQIVSSHSTTTPTVTQGQCLSGVKNAKKCDAALPLSGKKCDEVRQKTARSAVENIK